MAVTTVDRRTLINDADALTGWTGPTVLVSSPRAEGTNCVGDEISPTAGLTEWYYTSSPALDLDGHLLYIQSYTNALQNGWKEATLTDSSHMLYMSDGTNHLGLCQAGNDRDVFKHSGGGQVQFQSLLIDLDYLSAKDANGEIHEFGGTVGAFVKTSVDRTGSAFHTESKALGGGQNCFIDIMRYDQTDALGNSTGSNSGIFIYGGGSGTEGNFDELIADDISISADNGYGIIREYTAGSYGCQGRLKFGTVNPISDAYFLDSNFVLTFENRDVNDDKYAIFVFGNAIDTNYFNLSNGTITSAGPGVTCDFSSSGTNTLIFDTVSFIGLRRRISFPTDTSTGTTHDILSCTFDDCDQIDPGTADFQGCTISNYDDGISTGNGAVLLDSDGATNWQDLVFNSRGSGHAIYITTPGTYTFNNFTYNNYGASETTGSAVYNNSGGAVTINVSGGDSPSYRNGTGSSTSIVNTQTVEVYVKDTGLNNIEGARVYINKQPADSDYGHSGNPYTSGAGNGIGTGSYTVSQAIEGDTPGSDGWIEARQGNTQQAYRYASWDGNTFTFNSEVTGTDNGTGTSTVIYETGIGSKDIEEGDTIRNTTDGQWAMVQSVSANSVTTTKLSGGASWAGDNYSVHTLAKTYVEGVDTAIVPLLNKDTNASGYVSLDYNYLGDKDIKIRIRKSTETVKYLPYETSGQITNNGFSLTALLTADTIIG